MGDKRKELAFEHVSQADIWFAAGVVNALQTSVVRAIEKQDMPMAYFHEQMRLRADALKTDFEAVYLTRVKLIDPVNPPATPAEPTPAEPPAEPQTE